MLAELLFSKLLSTQRVYVDMTELLYLPNLFTTLPLYLRSPMLTWYKLTEYISFNPPSPPPPKNSKSPSMKGQISAEKNGGLPRGHYEIRSTPENRLSVGTKNFKEVPCKTRQYKTKITYEEKQTIRR